MRAEGQLYVRVEMKKEVCDHGHGIDASADLATCRAQTLRVQRT